MYKLYAQKLQGGWEKIIQAGTLKEIEKEAQYLTAKEYFSYMVVEHSKEGDQVITRKKLYDECEVEFVDEVKSKVEVKAMTFKPSRMKKKEELRKLTEEYIDR